MLQALCELLLVQDLIYKDNLISIPNMYFKWFLYSHDYSKNNIFAKPLSISCIFNSVPATVETRRFQVIAIVPPTQRKHTQLHWIWGCSQKNPYRNLEREKPTKMFKKDIKYLLGQSFFLPIPFHKVVTSGRTAFHLLKAHFSCQYRTVLITVSTISSLESN